MEGSPESNSGGKHTQSKGGILAKVFILKVFIFSDGDHCCRYTSQTRHSDSDDSDSDDDDDGNSNCLLLQACEYLSETRNTNQRLIDSLKQNEVKMQHTQIHMEQMQKHKQCKNKNRIDTNPHPKTDTIRYKY